jgi:hypothetical protein
MTVHSTKFAKHLISSGLMYTCLIPGGVHETVGNTPNHNLERAAYFRERYKNLTPAEREFRRERLRLYNNTPKRKGSKIEYIRKRRALLADTLSQESIAMESPTYTTEVVHPTTDTIEPDGSAVTPCDWVIPDIASNPFLPASTQTEDADSLCMSTRPLRRKQHVPRGERQAILARRNRQFEASISRSMATATEDTISDAEEGDDWTQPICLQRSTTMVITIIFSSRPSCRSFWLTDLDD